MEIVVINIATGVPELSSSPERYRAELRLHGQVGGQGANGIVLEVMPDYQFMNPEDTFRFVSRNGLNYVELYKALDRDVSAWWRFGLFV